MLTTLTAVLACALLTWLMIMLAATLKTKLWTPRGIQLAAGNRDGVGTHDALTGRASRAAGNMLENMVLFLAVIAAAHLAGKVSAAALGATIFFYARLAYWLVYLAGIPYVRTMIWAVSVVGLFMIGLAAV